MLNIDEIQNGIVIDHIKAGTAIGLMDLLGSASITLQVTENGESQTIVFSGDIGNLDQPLIRNPQYLTKADFVVMESTYGDRTHGPKPDYVAELTQILQETFDRGGNVVIPSFAVGRTQEMLYFIRQIKEEHRIHGHDNFPVFVDSPLASKSTTIFRENFSECYDAEALALVTKGENPLAFPGLQISETKEDSVAINLDSTPKVIISASGMCDAGRIRHHLKHNLSAHTRHRCTALLPGCPPPSGCGQSDRQPSPRRGSQTHVWVWDQSGGSRSTGRPGPHGRTSRSSGGSAH